MSIEILKAEHQYFIPTDHNFKPAELVVVLYWRNLETGLPCFDGTNMPKGLAPKVTATAYVSYGRWVVDCPFSGCFSAQVTSPDDPRFWCVVCHNQAVGGKWVKVTWPKKWKDIEAVLLQRPDVTTRNAQPHETPKSLMAENREKMK